MNLDQILILAKKEALLGELLAWLKAKGFYDEAMKDCPSGIKPEPLLARKSG